MNLDTFVTVLMENPDVALHLMLPSGSFVPAHFHVTEVGRVQKDFIDCGGTRRSTTTCVLQVWVMAKNRDLSYISTEPRRFRPVGSSCPRAISLTPVADGDTSAYVPSSDSR